MLEIILKYLSIITVSGAGISFVIGLWKYLDQRKIEARNTRYKMYHDLMGRISASDGSSGTLPLSQQVAAAYELQNFPEYSKTSLSVLRHLEIFFRQKKASNVLLEAITDTISVLERSNS